MRELRPGEGGSVTPAAGSADGGRRIERIRRAV
jgi:hypothetical protein